MVKTFNIAKNPKYDGYQRCLCQWSINVLIKKLLLEQLKLKLFPIKKYLKNYKTNYWKTSEKKSTLIFYRQYLWCWSCRFQFIRKFNIGFRFLLCAIDIYTKHVWVIPSKDKKGTTITNASQKRLNKSNYKRNKLWGDKGNEFHNRLVKSYSSE